MKSKNLKLFKNIQYIYFKKQKERNGLCHSGMQMS